MKIFISGGCKNGKSTTACRLATQLTKGGPLYYVATMIPRDDEDRARIRYHVRKRKGLGFQTVEWGRDIDRCQLPLQGATVLLDSVTALVQNETFSETGAFHPCTKKLIAQLEAFCQRAAHIVLISDYIYSDAGCYDPLTKAYCRSLAQVDRALASLCDVVVEVCAATVTVHKGQLPQFLEPLQSVSARELILGGAKQGKLDYAVYRYGIAPKEFYHCLPDREPDFNAQYVCDLENYVLYCLRHGLEPRTNWKSDAILLCRDLFCGVVPIDPEQRRWRDATGHYLAKLSAHAAHVTRLFGGLPQYIK